MKTIALTTPDPGTFTYTEGQTFYNEKLAHELLTIMSAMATEGYELTFTEDSDLNSAWTDQTTTLTQQAALLDALEESESLDAGWKTRLTSAKAQVASLLALGQTEQHLSVRSAAIAVLESLFQSVAGASLSADPEADSDLLDAFKAAFLKEVSQGIYTDSVIDKLGDLLEAVENQKTAIEDLKYNDEILEVPATPRPIRIHLQGKTIQQ